MPEKSRSAPSQSVEEMYSEGLGERLRSGKPTDTVTLGESIVVRGKLSGEEDVLILGRVDGRIDFKHHSVTVGKKGRVKANISAKTVSVEGEVHGDVYGEAKIIVRPSGSIEGDLRAPRVNLTDGAKFKGMIDTKAGNSNKEPSVPGFWGRVRRLF